MSVYKHKHYSIETVRHNLDERQKRKNDHLISLSEVRFHADSEQGDKLIFTDNEYRTRALTPTLTGWKQVCSNLPYEDGKVIPWEFFLHGMSSEQRKSVFDRLSANAETERLIRCQDDTLYGVVSPRYKPIDHDTIIPVLESAQTPIVAVKGSHVGFDHGKFRFIREQDAQDTSISIGEYGEFSANKHVPLIEFTNSENGLGSWKIRIGIYTFICTNGVIIGVELFGKRIVHLGNADIEIPDIDKLWDLGAGWVERLHKAEAHYISIAERADILQTANKKGLTQDMIGKAVDVANNEYNSGRTLGDTVNAFTRAAQAYRGDNIHKRTQMETYAGEVLQLAA